MPAIGRSMGGIRSHSRLRRSRYIRVESGSSAHSHPRKGGWAAGCGKEHFAIAPGKRRHEAATHRHAYRPSGRSVGRTGDRHASSAASYPRRCRPACAAALRRHSCPRTHARPDHRNHSGIPAPVIRDQLQGLNCPRLLHSMKVAGRSYCTADRDRCVWPDTALRLRFESGLQLAYPNPVSQ